MKWFVTRKWSPAPLAALLAMLLVILQADAALACSCRPRTPEQIMDAATVVVDGKVTGVAHDGGRLAATISVARIIKGRVGRELIVRTQDSSAACGIAFTPGQLVRIAADKLNDGLWTNLCLALPAPKPRS